MTKRTNYNILAFSKNICFFSLNQNAKLMDYSWSLKNLILVYMNAKYYQVVLTIKKKMVSFRPILSLYMKPKVMMI